LANFKLTLPHGQDHIQITKGLPEDPKVVDRFRDKVSFSKDKDKDYCTVDEGMAKMIEPWLPPGATLEPMDKKNGKK
jgi:hypothetical protein